MGTVLMPIFRQTLFAEILPQQIYTSFPIYTHDGYLPHPYTMPTLKTSDFKNIVLGPTRTCPECEEPELEITADPNIFECNFCGAIWHRLKPTATENGRIINKPDKLKKLLRKKR
jgi:ribosomal protein L37AE/L43A